MKRYQGLLLIMLCFLSQISSAVDLKTVSIDAKITDDSAFVAKALLTFTLEEQGDVKFFLNRAMCIEKVVLGANEPVIWKQEDSIFVLNKLKAGNHNVTISFRGVFPPELAEKSMIEASNQRVCLKDLNFWHPTIPMDCFSYAIKLDLPANLRGVSCGKLISRKIRNGREITQWEAPKVRTCGFILAAPFKVKTFSKDGITASLYWTNLKFKNTESFLKKGIELISFFKAQYGIWPYSNITFIEDSLMPTTNGRGINGAVFLSTRALEKCVFTKNSKSLTGFVAHEVSHLIWGSLVTDFPTKDSTFSFFLMTEGFAHFSALIYLAAHNPEDFNAFADSLKNHWRDFPANSPYKFNAADMTVPKMSHIAKCGFFLYDLKRQLGDDIWFKAVHRVLRKNIWNLASFREIEDIIQSQKQDIAPYLEKWYSSTDLFPPGILYPRF
ncbi:MAG: hypothetical protein M0R31_00235 [Candidatus Riflebacteria bacterium]|nr:hypothetical protein [Candidatus Riflebacteria bacterium]